MLKNIIRKIFKKKRIILQRASKEEDINYSVEMTKELERIVKRSGYKIRHLGPYSAVGYMNDEHGRFTLNPYRMNGAEASKKEYPHITAEEYLKKYSQQ